MHNTQYIPYFGHGFCFMISLFLVLMGLLTVTATLKCMLIPRWVRTYPPP